MSDLYLIIPLVFDDGTTGELVRFVATLYAEQCGAAVTALADVVEARCVAEGALDWFEEY